MLSTIDSPHDPTTNTAGREAFNRRMRQGDGGDERRETPCMCAHALTRTRFPPSTPDPHPSLSRRDETPLRIDAQPTTFPIVLFVLITSPRRDSGARPGAAPPQKFTRPPPFYVHAHTHTHAQGLSPPLSRRRAALRIGEPLSIRAGTAGDAQRSSDPLSIRYPLSFTQRMEGAQRWDSQSLPFPPQLSSCHLPLFVVHSRSLCHDTTLVKKVCAVYIAQCFFES